MAAEPRRAPMMSLQQLVANYRTLAGEFGKPVAISAFALTTEETERLFSGYDEDYHISRFFDFLRVHRRELLHQRHPRHARLHRPRNRNHSLSSTDNAACLEL